MKWEGKEFKMRLKNIPIGFFILQGDNIAYANSELCRMIGYEIEKIKGMKIKELVSPEDWKKFLKIFSAKKKRKRSFELSLLHRDKRRRVNVKIQKDFTKFKDEGICLGTVMDIDSIDRVADEILSLLGELHSFFEESKEAMYVTSRNGKVLNVNPEAVKLFGYKSKENFLEANVKNHYLDLIDREDFQKTIEKDGYVKDYELTLKAKNGRLMDVSVTASVLKDEEGKAIAYRGVIRDLTDHKKIEERLRQFQKMEAIGRLAGGIAHDFNNLLTVILGNTEILLRKTKPEDPFHEKLKLIFETAEKASGLTSQLLTFSSSKSISQMNFNLNTLIHKIGRFLSRAIGEKIKLDLFLNPEVACVRADPNQIEQVILNLALNAKDAMPEGGKLTISTDNVELKESECKLNPEARPGKYSVIKVSDTGTGIPEEIIDRIFEPFFTTKEKGSGLGLSIVYGIVKQSGGHITVESKLSEGTTFKVFIPASEERIDHLSKNEKKERVFPVGKGRVLVVEDDPGVLEFIKDVLESSGYEVSTALNGEEGIKIAKERGEFTLLITDMVLPKMNGLETAKEILKIFPKIKIIFMSGYPSNKISQIYKIENALFLQKPFTPSFLLENIDNILKK